MISTVKVLTDTNILVNYKTINSRLALGDFNQARVDPLIKSLIGILTSSQVSDTINASIYFQCFTAVLSPCSCHSGHLPVWFQGFSQH